MYKKNQHIRAHKAAQNKLRQANHFESQQGIDKRSAQDTRYTPTPVPNHPGSVIARSRLDSDNRNWILLDGDPGVERHSPDSALTASSNGSNPSFHRGGVGGGGGGLGGGEFSAPSKFRRSQSIPNLSEPSPSFPLEQLSRTISGSPETQRTSSLSKSGGPRPQVQGPSDVHRGPFVRVKVGPYDDHDADRGVVESSSLVRNKYRSEPNLFNPKANEPVPRNENRQPFSVRTFEMKKTLGMFGFVLSCKYVLNDAMVPRELRSFPRIDTATVEGVAYRSGVRHGHFVLEINGQSAELSSLTRCTSLLQLGGHHLRMKIASNHLTNDPISDNKQGPKSTTGNNFSRDLPSSDLPRHRVCYRESALQKRLMSSRPQQRMKRASSTPNLADDDQNHIYEELAEPTRSPPPPLPKVVVVESTPAPQTDSGRRGSDLSVGGTRSVVGVRQKTPGKPDSVQKHPMRSETGQENIGRAAISRTTSVDFPPSPPPRPVPDRIVPPPEKPPGQRGPYPGPMKPGRVQNGDDTKSKAAAASVEMKISPGVGIASIVASAASSSSSASAGVVTPMTFSSFTGPFKDDVASDVRAAPSARLPCDSGVAMEEEDGRSSRGFLTMMMTGSAMDVSRMQTARNGRRMETSVVPRSTGNDASIIGGSHIDFARIQKNGPGGNIPVSRNTGNDASIGGSHIDITGTQTRGRGGNISVSHNTGYDTSIGRSHIDITGIQMNQRGGNMPMSGHAGNQRRIADSEGTGNNNDTAGVRSNTFGTQISEPHRGRETPVSQHPGTTSRKMSVEDSGSSGGTFGSRNDVFGDVVAEIGSASRFPGNNYGQGRNREISEIRATSGAISSGFSGGKSEFPSPQSLPDGPKTAPIRKDEPLSLLDAIRQHPLMRNDRLTSNSVDPHSTVAPASHEIIARHGPQPKVHPPIPPPPKPKTYKTAEISEGSINRYYNPDMSTSLPQEPNTHGVTLRVKNPRPTDQNFSKNDDAKAAQSEGPAGSQCIPKPPQRPAIGPQTTNGGGTRPKKGDFLLTKSGLKYRVKDQDPRQECEAPVELRNPRHRTRIESHPPQVLRLDGVTVDQSYSDDNRTTDGLQIQRTADRETDEPAPIFRFDSSTGMLLLSDATVDQSSTESDALLPLLPPPPPSSSSFTPEFRLSQLPLQDVSWSSGFGSSSRTFSSPFNDRSISANSESVFLEDVASPPPPVFFIDPVENGSLESKHQSEHPVASHPPSNPPAIPPRTNQPVSPQETVITKPSGVRRRPPPPPITDLDEENISALDSNHGTAPVVNNKPSRPQKLYSNPETVIPRPSEIGTNSPQTAGDPGSVLLPPMFNNTPSRPPKLQSDSKTIIPGRSEIGKISTQTAEDPGSVPLPPAEFQNTSFNTIPQLSRPPDPPSKNHPGSVPLPPTEFHNTSADTMPKPSTPSRPPDRPPSKNHPGIVPLPPPSTNHPGNTSADTMPQPSRPYRPVTPQPSKQHRPPDPPSSTNHPGRANGEVATRDRVPSEGSVTDWSSSDVADWLRQVGQGRHAVSFQSHGVDGPRLTAMTRRDLIDLGVTAMTDRRDIERGVIRLRSLQST